NVVADRFGATVTPESYVIDSSGTIRYHGQIDDSRNEARIRTPGLRMALDAVLAGKPVTVQETKAFGCTIKRVRQAGRITSALAPIDESGFQRLVASNKGKVVVYDFWATYC